MDIVFEHIKTLLPVPKHSKDLTKVKPKIGELRKEGHCLYQYNGSVWLYGSFKSDVAMSCPIYYKDRPLNALDREIYVSDKIYLSRLTPKGIVWLSLELGKWTNKKRVIRSTHSSKKKIK